MVKPEALSTQYNDWLQCCACVLFVTKVNDTNARYKANKDYGTKDDTRLSVWHLISPNWLCYYQTIDPFIIVLSKFKGRVVTLTISMSQRDLSTRPTMWFDEKFVYPFNDGGQSSKRKNSPNIYTWLANLCAIICCMLHCSLNTVWTTKNAILKFSRISFVIACRYISLNNQINFLWMLRYADQGRQFGGVPLNTILCPAYCKCNQLFYFEQLDV